MTGRHRPNAAGRVSLLSTSAERSYVRKMLIILSPSNQTKGSFRLGLFVESYVSEVILSNFDGASTPPSHLILFYFSSRFQTLKTQETLVNIIKYARVLLCGESFPGRPLLYAHLTISHFLGDEIMQQSIRLLGYFGSTLHPWIHLPPLPLHPLLPRCVLRCHYQRPLRRKITFPGDRFHPS